MSTPRRVHAGVVSVEPWGGYVRLVLTGDGLGTARPGQFVAVDPSGPGSSLVAARAFGVHRADPAADSVSVVVAGVGAGSRWTTARRPGDRVAVTGPLGRPFTLPVVPAGAASRRAWIGVGGGYGSAALAWTATEAAAAGAWTAVVSGAATASRLCDGPALAAALGDRLRVTTDDGSAGERGSVLGPLAALVAQAWEVAGPDGTVTVAGCGPMGMLRAVTEAVSDTVTHVEVAVEERMACGIGICMTCVLPVVGDDGRTRMVRACTEGPVLPGGRVRWDAATATGFVVPDGAVGAPA